jgi:hypothetical protein
MNTEALQLCIQATKMMGDPHGTLEALEKQLNEAQRAAEDRRCEAAAKLAQRRRDLAAKLERPAVAALTDANERLGEAVSLALEKERLWPLLEAFADLVQ